MERVGADDTPENREELYKALLDADLLVPLPEEPEGDGVVEADAIEVVLLSGEDGPVLPVFTTEERLLEWRPEGCGYATIGEGAIFEMAAGSDIQVVLVNHDSANTGWLVRREIEALARGRLPSEHGETFREVTVLRIAPEPVGQPPPDVVAAVRESLALEKRAQAAWFFQIQQDSQAPELAVAVALKGRRGAVERAMNAIVQRAGDAAPGVADLLFVPVEARDPRWGEPFFKR
jgi:SseB protein N-terminal domain/SseB protein C-terminal domain